MADAARNLTRMLVRAVDNAEKDPKAVTRWINSINDLHRHKPPPSVHYSKPMPDIEALMQIWPAQFEELLETVRLPDADMQAELPELVRIVCALLDIPVYNSLTESLHVRHAVEHRGQMVVGGPRGPRCRGRRGAWGRTGSASARPRTR